MGVGFIVGPVVGGLMGAINLHLPFYLAGGLTLLNLLYGYFVLPESLPLAKRKPFTWRDTNPVHALRGLTQLRGVGPLVGVVALSGLAQFVLYTVWVLYNAFKFGWGPEENGCGGDGRAGARRVDGPVAQTLQAATPGHHGVGVVGAGLLFVGRCH
jgi:DHA1 family tetracycline resistance protein-like MFS transporter